MRSGPAGTGLAGLIVMVIIGGVGGFIGGAIVAVIYNFVLGAIGGIEVDMEVEAANLVLAPGDIKAG